jgi:transcriptional regulator with XRE-family HTH domain
MAELDVELGEWVRKGREARGWTQTELGDMVGVNRRTVHLWEKGTFEPREEFMSRLRELLGRPEAGIEEPLQGGEWIDVLNGGRVPFPAGVIEADEGAVLKAVMARGRGARGMAWAVVDKSAAALKELRDRSEGNVVVADGDAWVLGTLSTGRIFRRSGGTLTSKLPQDAQVLPVVAVFEAMA